MHPSVLLPLPDSVVGTLPAVHHFTTVLLFTLIWLFENYQKTGRKITEGWVLEVDEGE